MKTKCDKPCPAVDGHFGVIDFKLNLLLGGVGAIFVAFVSAACLFGFDILKARILRADTPPPSYVATVPLQKFNDTFK